jgi:WD40 repeat protein
LKEDFTAAALVVTLPSPPSNCVILAFHPSGRHVATGEVQKNGVTKENDPLERGISQSFITKLWVLNEDYTAASCLTTLPPQTEYPATQARLYNCGLGTLHAAFHPSGRFLATGHHQLRMWALKDDCSAATHVSTFGRMNDGRRGICDNEHSIAHMAFHPSWLYLVTSTATRKYKYTNWSSYPSRQLWAVKADCSAARTIYSQNYIQQPEHGNRNFAFHPSGNQVAVQPNYHTDILHIRQLK